MGACSPAWVTGRSVSCVCPFSPFLGVLAQLAELFSSALRGSRTSILSPGALGDFLIHAWMEEGPGEGVGTDRGGRGAGPGSGVLDEASMLCRGS